MEVDLLLLRCPQDSTTPGTVRQSVRQTSVRGAESSGSEKCSSSSSHGRDMKYGCCCSAPLRLLRPVEGLEMSAGGVDVVLEMGG